MKIQNAIKMIAGSFVFITSLLGYLHHISWLFATMFVGLNLFQYSLTGFCPMEIMLRKLGMRD